MTPTEDLVKAVHEHWVLSGVEPDQAGDMAEELNDHLAAAVADGKAVETVVGDDLRQFADDWAEPIVEPMTLAGKVQIIVISVVMFAISTTAMDGVVEGHSGATIDPFFVLPAGLLGGLIAFAVVTPLGSRVRKKGVRSRLADWLMWTALFAVLSGAGPGSRRRTKPSGRSRCQRGL